MKACMQTNVRQLLTSFLLGQVLESPWRSSGVQDSHERVAVAFTLSPAWVTPTSDLHHATAWAGAMLVPGLCFP